MPERFMGAEPTLARLLLLASRWFDTVSRERLVERGWPPLSAAQTLLFAQLWPGDITVAELARRLGNSRQATHEMVRGLVALGFLELADDPRRRGGRLVRLTPRGYDLFADSADVLNEIEASLDREHTRSLRTALAGLGLHLGAQL
jgi:DNA-binding MarR family transcriptional regulator